MSHGSTCPRAREPEFIGTEPKAEEGVQGDKKFWAQMTAQLEIASTVTTIMIDTVLTAYWALL